MNIQELNDIERLIKAHRDLTHGFVQSRLSMWRDVLREDMKEQIDGLREEISDLLERPCPAVQHPTMEEKLFRPPLDEMLASVKNRAMEDKMKDALEDALHGEPVGFFQKKHDLQCPHCFKMITNFE